MQGSPPTTLPDPAACVHHDGPAWWQPEAALVRERAARLPLQPWDPALLPPPDPIGVAAGRLLAATVAIPRIGASKAEPSLRPTKSPIRLIATRHGCSNPRGLVTVGPDGATSMLLVPCDRLTCPECRGFNGDTWAERVLAAFEGRLMYREVVPAADWVAWKARAARRGVDRVAVPAVEGGRVVFTTGPVDPTAELVLDEGQAVREALEMRPFGDRRRVRATPGFLPAAEPAPDPAALEVVGWWNAREGVRQAAAAAAAVGLRVRRYNPTPRVMGGFALEGIDWQRDRHRPELARFLRLIAFEAVPQAESGPPLAGRWDADPCLRRRKAEEPPLSAYREAFEAVA